MKDLKQFIKTTIREFLNETHSKNISLTDNEYVKLFNFFKIESPNKYNLKDLKNKFNDMINHILSLQIDGCIDVYRHMYVKKFFISNIINGNIKNLGKYWTFDESKAMSWDYDNSGHDLHVLLHIKVGIEYIDWYETFEKHLIFAESFTESELVFTDINSLYLKSITDITNNKVYKINKDGFFF